ncbi:methionine adenosyltransferase [Thermoflexus sp.]|uniref:methionine adenosyltransferase n=1 Tax=Thermoflexus sp. TaxID=1969742 RepID=UPI0025FC4ABD|nr:methionine adenosyltransferase [Thermoflexus sp.]MDW8180364.1 methionine adenosyltransferase [Anaerolineae bacterium]MCS6964866.1 methionine adenosyltransferase [Thermoflexus sp.]MCS7350913.1 methionine adenosyltransferase [Thermoflexus sp.]MCX7690058.1 methionine adenosyltransferase [Thermoflexus sp.]MDW8185392.1 methionine adenosyltransferase [Anaerolineae bacterium]
MRNIVVSEASGPYIENLPVEIVERKGIGHPDSLCDGIAERISREYTRWCEEHLGGALHHNFDKVQLVAGEVSVRFGGGELLKPIRIQIAGRGTPFYNGQAIPMETIAIEAARAYLRETMRYLDPVKHVIIDCFAGRGASELIDIVHQVTANDTSFGVAHWPRSGLEEAVYQAAQYLNYELINQFPIGEDVKVMGLRQENQVILTVAVPFIATRVHDPAEYEEAKRSVQEALQRFVSSLPALEGRTVRVDVNTADHAKRGDFYLTLTGTSAEMGDDGAVGRGNRITGLITPFRSTSLEAAAGKNPISHVGKVYNVLALEIARAIVARLPEVQEATVYLLSQIGKPLDQPLIANAAVRVRSGRLTPGIQEAVRAIMDEHLSNIHGVRRKIIAGEISLF